MWPRLYHGILSSDLVGSCSSQVSHNCGFQHLGAFHFQSTLPGSFSIYLRRALAFLSPPCAA